MAWVAVPIWHGTLEEASALAAALENNCECEKLKRRCGAHQAMLDQRWLDTILFLRWMRKEGIFDADRDGG